VRKFLAGVLAVVDAVWVIVGLPFVLAWQRLNRKRKVHR
jgi:hypothetical protein